MKATITLLLVLFMSTLTQAQSKSEAFAQLNKLLANAKGQKYTEPISGNTHTVTRQQFSESIILHQFITEKYGVEMVYRYSELPWAQLNYFFVSEARGNESLYQIHLDFDKDVKTELYSPDEKGDNDPSYYSEIKLYVLKKDHEKARELLEIISKHFTE